MKKNEVKIGGVYTAKVTNKVVQVRIDAREPPRRLGRDEPGHRQEGPHQEPRAAARRPSATREAADGPRRPKADADGRRHRARRRRRHTGGRRPAAEPKPGKRASGPRPSPSRSG